MSESFLAAWTAVWLGVLTSISPCPLASNIAAVSFIGRRLAEPRRALAAGLLYTLGRMTTYLVLGAVIVLSLLSVTDLSLFLQRYMNRALGPILILVGMFLLELLSFGTGRGGVNEALGRRAERHGFWGAFALGVIFALSFCPISAALFFGSLIPLALRHQSGIGLPALYGLGTGLPVFAFAVVLALGARSLGVLFRRLTQFELWARRITGTVFILVGIYYTGTTIFGW
jgi:cytochrome c-type biogenesis protein